MIATKSKHKSVNNISLILKELLRTSKQGGSTLEELADLCGVSTRNIYRYLNIIETMGFQLVRPSNLDLANKVKGCYKLSFEIPQPSYEDIDLLMLIFLYKHKAKQYREHIKLIYEVFVSLLALKNGLILPIDWKTKQGFE
jgi:transcriptional antiterminator